MRRGIHTSALLVVTSIILAPTTRAFAKPPSAYDTFDHITAPPPIAHSPKRWLGSLFIRAGHLGERAGLARPASNAYWTASELIPSARERLLLKVGELYARDPITTQADFIALENTGVLDARVPGAELLQLRLSARANNAPWPDPTLTERALTHDTPDKRACAWLIDRANAATGDSRTWSDVTDKLEPKQRVRATEIARSIHRHCSYTTKLSWADELGVPLRPADRLERQATLLGQVRFYFTLHETSAIEFDQLSPAQRCRATFNQARATYRIRKLRSDSQPLYYAVIDSCDTTQSALLRRRSLYAVGKRHFERGRFTQSTAAFSALLEDYPETSHADDALLYLARSARARGDRAEELALMRRALADHPSGDMTHELVWETYEHLLYDGKWQEFIDAMSSLNLPEHDNQYFSQGRIEYMRGLAHKQLGQTPKATAFFEEAWSRYPFSFYGYLANLELSGSGGEAARFELDTAARSRSLLADEAWRGSDAALFANLGMFDWAAQIERARVSEMKTPTPEALWRLAWLEHKAGRYHISHNIARRRISGRPWSSPREGRVLRLGVAWPDPFGALVDSAHADEAKQDPSTPMRPEIARAIMREESSFIPGIESYAGALGLMQLMPATARGHDDDLAQPATPERLKLPEVNIRVAVDHLFHLARQKKSHPVLMAAAYNAGAGSVRKWTRSPRTRQIALWVEDIPYKQARHYTKRVIGSYLAYQILLGRTDIDNRVIDDARL